MCFTGLTRRLFVRVPPGLFQGTARARASFLRLYVLFSIPHIHGILFWQIQEDLIPSTVAAAAEEVAATAAAAATTAATVESRGV